MKKLEIKGVIDNVGIEWISTMKVGVFEGVYIIKGINM